MQKNKSVLIIGINFFPEPTGIGKYTAELAFSLAEMGVRVDVITAYPYYPQWKVYDGYKNRWYKKEIIRGVSVTRCPFYVPASLSGLKRMLQDFSFFMSALLALLGKMVKGNKYDLLFVPSPSFMSGFVGLFYRIFFRKTKYVYHIQDLQVDAAEELEMIKSPMLLKILKFGEGIILKNADWVTTISKGMEEKIKAKPYKISRQYLFPNWVDFGNIYSKVPSLESIAHLGFPLDKKLVFYSGAVGEKQGLEMVLEVAKLAGKQLPELVFVIAGSGPYAAILQQKTADSGISNLYFIALQPTVIFNELLNHAFLHLVIQKDKASDLLLPSKLTNILAVGGIAMVTAAPGTTLYNIVHSNRVGMILPPDNLQAFWEALVSITAQPEQASEIRKNAIAYAQRYLQKDTIIAEFLSEIQLSALPLNTAVVKRSGYTI